MEYGFSKIVELSFERAIIKVTDELKKEGFGILTSIDVQDTLKKRINVDFKKYVILGACNPVLAHKALSAEEQLGLFLPCNVVVAEAEDKTVKVSFFDPEVMSKLIESPVIITVAAEVKQKLLKVLEHI